MCCNHRMRTAAPDPPRPPDHGPPAARPDARRPRRAALSRSPDMGVGGARRKRLRRDDRPAGRAARGACARAPALHAERPRGGSLARRNRQGAVRHRRRQAARGGADAVSEPSGGWKPSGRWRPCWRWRRAPLDLRLLAVGLPAHVHLLRDRRDAVRPQPERLGDPRSGAALPPHRSDRPLRVHGHGRADAEPRQRARRMRAPAGRGDHASAHDDLDGRLDPGHRTPHRVRHAAAPGAVAARRRRSAALAS